LGSGTEKKRGIPTRFEDYDREELYAVFVADAIRFGWNIAHRCIIAWAPQVESIRHHHLQLLFLVLEATLSHAYAMHDHDQMKSMEKAFWNPATLDYQGLCSRSALQEAYFIEKFFKKTKEEIRVDEEASKILKKASMKRAGEVYRSNPENKLKIGLRAKALYAENKAKPTAKEATAEYNAKRKEKRNSAEEKLKRNAQDRARRKAKREAKVAG